MSKLAQNIVRDIVNELTNRKGIGDEWFSIEMDIQEEIIGDLEAVVDRNIKRIISLNNYTRMVPIRLLQS